MSHLWQPPAEIHVQQEDDTLRFVHWQGKRYVVQQVIYRWRKREWWRGIWREYYKLVLTSGQATVLVVVFWDFEAQAWYLQTIYD